MKGEAEILANLKKEIDGIKLKVNRGLLKAALVVKLDSMERTPVDVGLLRASHYIGDVDMTSDNFIVQVGAETDYAIYVHENLEAHHTVGEAKFLENALNNNSDTILKVIQDTCRIK